MCKQKGAPRGIPDKQNVAEQLKDLSHWTRPPLPDRQIELGFAGARLSAPQQAHHPLVGGCSGQISRKNDSPLSWLKLGT